MAHIQRLLVVVCVWLVAVLDAHAGYAQLKPPQGWAAGMGAAVPGQAGTFNYGSAANGAAYVGGTVRTNAALAVAGQVVTMPASMRLAANAATVAATFSFGNPLLFATLAVGTLAYNYFKDSGFEVQNGVWVEKKVQRVCDGPCYLFGHQSGSYGMHASQSAGGDAYASGRSGPYATFVFNGCPGGSIASGYLSCKLGLSGSSSFSEDFTMVVVTAPFTETVSFPDAQRADFIDRLGQKSLPPGLPEKLDVPLPVLPPVFNPDPAIDPQPAPAVQGFPRPLFVPTGNPVPTSDPNVWNQPGVRVSPAPTPDNPWRVDVVPEDIPQPNGTPRTSAELNPASPIAPGTPRPPSASETPGLCDLFPGILACADLDVGPDTTVETKQKDISVTPDTGWGSAGGSCPVGRTLSHGAVYSFQPMCDFATGVKPVLIAVAWLGAALLLLGFKAGSE